MVPERLEDYLGEQGEYSPPHASLSRGIPPQQGAMGLGANPKGGSYDRLQEVAGANRAVSTPALGGEIQPTESNL
jgi:hypothetical protein